MTIIHVHELYSNQVVEITANSISDCLWAYARHNAWDLKELTLERLNGSNVWLAIWEDMDV